MAKLLDYNATLVGRDDLTPLLGVFRVRFDEPIDGEGDWFVPGQYLVIGLNNPDPEMGGVQRPMSIASAARNRDHVEFYIRFVSQPTSDNPFTHLLWKLKVGDRMYMRPKPRGKFTVADTIGDEDPRLKVFVSAGTGLAPFVCIARSRELASPGASQADHAVLHGASYAEDLGYRQELSTLAESTGLRYLPTVSRPHESAGWKGSTGRVEDLFREERLLETERLLGLAAGELTPERAVVFVCGLQGTIGATIERLACRGFVPDHKRIRRALEVDDEVPDSLFFEQYDAEPVIDLHDEPLLERIRGHLRAARR